MDELEVVTKTLNSTIQRHGRVVQAYEVEIANMTAELLRLQDQMEKNVQPVEEKKITKTSSNP